MLGTSDTGTSPQDSDSLQGECMRSPWFPCTARKHHGVVLVHSLTAYVHGLLPVEQNMSRQQ